MLVMTFDLSSKAIGVCIAKLTKDQLEKIRTIVITPQKPNGTTFGFTTQLPKQLHHNGSTYQTYLYPHEITVSKEEAAKRIKQVKNMTHLKLLNNIGEQCGQLLNTLQPQVVAIEKNKSFNGILTTKLLAEIAGGIYFHCGAHGITMYDVDEATVRSYIRKQITHFDRTNKDGVQALETKWEIHCRLRQFFNDHHPNSLDFTRITLDETDALAVFYYVWHNQIRGQKNG